MLEHLKAIIPDGEVVLALEPEELAGKLLFILRQNGGNMFQLSNIEAELGNSVLSGSELYPRGQWAAIGLALREAAAWLLAQGLVIPAEGTNGKNGWCVLSRRAQKFQDERQFASYTAARRLPRENLHPRIGSKVWMAFMRNEFDVAAFQAMKGVEIAVREAADFSQGEHGVPMIRRAFHKDTGPLTDEKAEDAEKEALSALFAGAIGLYKNPHSHRDVDLTDPAEAAEIVMLANLLLRIVDSRAEKRGD
ncbi:uncharacterized protein (TIGR02391 family) [Sphingobium sp. B11D3B]|uniref:TIGR02391 family protein n=1 Tax=Sphingobium sp. B11D3B TaxID=2940575 RepID=UPI002227DCAF|nr:TIGR02391 family protein [Sphingobium sp. B11D3B]MCW2388966.1 uncharacterized protein (TIGR02391 family) [Sphingobium sp. B11D3B]